MVDVVGGGFEDILDRAQLPAILRDCQEADNLEAIVLAVG